jgi:hypothetical protein
MTMTFSLRLTTYTLCAGLLLSFASTAGHAADERCGQLVALNKQYRGVALTDEQQALKVQLVAWYKENCGRSASRHARLGAGYRSASTN